MTIYPNRFFSSISSKKQTKQTNKPMFASKLFRNNPGCDSYSGKFKGQMNGSAAHDSFTTVDSVIFSLRFQFLLILDADYKLNKL